MQEYNGWTVQKLRDFTKEIIVLWEAGKIRSPIHLNKGNEKQIIKIFSEFNITIKDWVFSNHRSHFHWLLSGRNPEKLKEEILKGHSMHLFDNKFFTSAIVGGNAPIALGVAYALKLKGSTDRVFCFCGDMSASGGLFHESVQFSQGFDLPITYIIENDSMSVRAITKDTWGRAKTKKVVKYTYKRKIGHSGSGAYIMW